MKLVGCYLKLIWVFYDRSFLSDYLTDLYTVKSKKIFVKNCPQWGLKPRSSGQCLTNWARQESVGQEISEVSFVCFMHHFTCWTLFISRINRAWLYKGHKDSGWQLNVDLAQLVKHWPEDPEVLVSNPTESNFWGFFCSSLCKHLSDYREKPNCPCSIAVCTLRNISGFQICFCIFFFKIINGWK